MWKSVIFYFFIAIYKSNDDLNMGTNVQKNHPPFHPPFNSAQNMFCSNILPCRYDFMDFSAILGEDPHSRLLHMTTTSLSTPLFYTIEKIVISAFFLVITILSENAFVLLCRSTKNKEIRSCSMKSSLIPIKKQTFVWPPPREITQNSHENHSKI